MRHLSIQTKLLLSFVAVLLGAIVVSVIYYWYAYPRVRIELDEARRVERISALMEDHYIQNQTINGVGEALIRRLGSISGPPVPSQDNALPPTSVPIMLEGLEMIGADGTALIPFENYLIGDLVDEQFIEDAHAVRVEGEIIGYIVQESQDDFQLSYFSRASFIATVQVLSIAALLTIIVATGIAYILSRRLAQPIIALTQSTEQMAQGDLSISVPAESEDELGALTRSFNQMSADLDVAFENRKRMTAEIAHDLGNPLQVVYGYVEAMEDGILELTPERFETVVVELERLKLMIDDLNLLAQADAKTLQLEIGAVDVAQLLTHMQESYTPLAQADSVEINIEQTSSSQPLFVKADQARLIQVLGNLLSNALRYTPTGGNISLRATTRDDTVTLAVRDSGRGIEPEHLPYIFEQFYQIDEDDLDAEKGKMGLGLAICKALIEAMDGRISVRSNEGFQGTEFQVVLPVGSDGND
ncbi:MAG: HAMP domain-containing sensor histidine kinase [Chloroflexota bacterium]